MILVRRPSPALAPYVESLWYYDGCPAAPRAERVLPNGRFQVVIDLERGPGSVAGLRSRHVVIDTVAIPEVMGIVLRPGGARAFFDAPASDFQDRVVSLDLLWGARAARWRERLQEVPSRGERLRVLEAALLRTLSHAGDARLALHPVVRYAVAQFERAPRVRGVIGVAREAGLSRRRLGQLFREQVGMTPKRYCRVHRFLDVVRRVASGHPIDWAEVALAGGYCDQAHLNHEFREFSGLSPGRFLAAERPSLTHVRID